MILNGDVALNASRQAIWKMLLDPNVLKACIPGCEELVKLDDCNFEATAKVKVGPVAARFKGKVTLEDLDEPNGCKIVGRGEGGIAGFAKGSATVTLADIDSGTLLTYHVDAQIGGKLAQLGQRLISSAAKTIADAFFAKLAALSQLEVH
ncbi:MULTISPECIES: CoxG family protein [Bradyrhizobium]|uniref:CoxG family protein n=1 Tax=Bradyrhizobium TaxID=374 RepID=UPI001449F610|nr:MULTISPECIES: carbon monoxide dehydrogenase subunit G [Bradyrhizobium]MCP1924710.1 carbon monoxide dehydrogenase subunit G [Bradyrhizobium elkanii]MCS3584530.1 carbon monoxide dehydrogenase subunit G [Bradyrhizobium elkanii]MCS3718110.1 carbon monoxide dehydrogenase subunit G [Bradyrhizobium elkanii]MCS4011818.1 carbon monoxide dehydrogenase subunit G [Bradyrhizobium elkanii USDA 61]QOZ19638.1 carbon monoxide dehydrogenase [Bradyrhizobium sp. CCBAU 21365]